MKGFGKRFGESVSIDRYGMAAQGYFYRIVGRRELKFEWTATRYLTHIRVTMHRWPGAVEYLLHEVSFFSEPPVGNPNLQKFLDYMDRMRVSTPSNISLPWDSPEAKPIQDIQEFLEEQKAKPFSFSIGDQEYATDENLGNPDPGKTSLFEDKRKTE